MRTYRSILLSVGGLALCASMATFGSVVIPATALACPDEAHAGEGKCDCGMDEAACAAAKAAGGCAGCDKADGDCAGGDKAKADGSCAGCDKAKADGGCAGCDKAKADGSCAGCDKAAGAKDDKACACAPGEDGKCTCGSDCPVHHGGKCAKEGAAAPGDKKEGGCHGEDKGEGASAAPSGGKGLVAAVDPATGELVAPGAASAAGLTDSASVVEPTAGTKAAHEVAGGAAGTMAEFPENRISRSVASVDADGKVHVGCQHEQEER
jgi:hypothetical protein